MSLNSSVNSTDSDVFYVEQLSDEPSPRRNNTPDILNSTERTDHQAVRMPSVSTIASPQPHFVTINDDSNDITMPYGFGQQVPIVPPSLNDLNLPPNPFNILATMQVVVDRTEDDNNAEYSPESPDPSLPSSISSPPMSVSAFHSFETTHTTTDDNIFIIRPTMIQDEYTGRLLLMKLSSQMSPEESIPSQALQPHRRRRPES